MRRFRVIAYDIASDSSRRRMEKLARRFADRVQDSVYEGRLSDKETAELLRRAASLLHPATDSLRVYLLCADCSECITCIGGVTPVASADDILV